MACAPGGEQYQVVGQIGEGAFGLVFYARGPQNRAGLARLSPRHCCASKHTQLMTADSRYVPCVSNLTSPRECVCQP
jgi:hypothetical protein